DLLLVPSHCMLLHLLIGSPPTSTLFPYTTLFRSLRRRSPAHCLLLEARGPEVGPSVDRLIHVTARIHPSREVGRERPVVHVRVRSEEHTSELQSLTNLVCRLLPEKKAVGRGS